MSNYYSLYEIEEIILGMADIVHENRTLREENKKLQIKLDERNNVLNKFYDNTLENQATLFKFIIKKDKEGN